MQPRIPPASRAVQVLLALLIAAMVVSTALTNVLALLASIVALVWWIRYRPFALLRQPLLLLCLAFLGWMVLRDLIAGVGLADALRGARDFRPVLFIVLWAPLFLPLAHRRVAAWAFGACIAAFCVFALGMRLPATGLPLDPHGIINPAGIVGPVIVVFTVAALQLAVDDPARRRLWCAAAVLGAAALTFATISRTGYVLLAACIAGFALFNLRSVNYKMLGLAALAMALFIALSPIVHQRMEKMAAEIAEFQQTDPAQQGQVNTSSGLRLRFWSVTVQIVKQSPLLGTGLFAFPQAYGRMDAAMGGKGLPWRNPHNEYLYVLASLGIVGLALHLLIHAEIVRRSRGFTYPLQRKLVWLGLLAFMASISFNSCLIDMEPGHLFAVLVLCAALFDWKETESLTGP